MLLLWPSNVPKEEQKENETAPKVVFWGATIFGAVPYSFSHRPSPALPGSLGGSGFF